MARRRGSIVRRGDTFAIRNTGADGRRHLETIGRGRDAERAAEKALTARLRELDTGVWREPTDESVAEYAVRWLERKRARLAPSTYRSYKVYLDGHVLPLLGNRRLSSLRPDDFDELVAKLEAKGKPAGTVRNCIVPVRAMLSDAVRRGLLPSNPAARVDLPPAPSSSGVDIPPEHVAAIRGALVALAPKDPYRPGERDLFAAMAWDVAVATGLRWSEQAALRWRNCDFERRRIVVEEASVLGQVKRPKSGHVRTVPMFDSVRAALRTLASRALDRCRYGPDELVFASARGTPLGGSNWNHRVWMPALQRARLGDWRTDESGERRWTSRYRWHDARHTAVSRLIEAGADVALVQSVAGHSSAATTLRVYAHLRDSRIEEAARLYDPGRVDARTSETDL